MLTFRRYIVNVNIRLRNVHLHLACAMIDKYK